MTDRFERSDALIAEVEKAGYTLVRDLSGQLHHGDEIGEHRKLDPIRAKARQRAEIEHELLATGKHVAWDDYQRAVTEAGNLRDQIEALRTAFQCDLQGLRDERDQLTQALADRQIVLDQNEAYYAEIERLRRTITTQADALHRRHEITATAVERYRRLAEFADSYLEEECRLDHHGCCQAHGLADAPCPVGEYRAHIDGSERTP